MARQSTFPLYDRILGGQLREILTTWQAEGVSLAEMSFRLRERDVHVAAETVRRWLRDLDDEPDGPANDEPKAAAS